MNTIRLEVLSGVAKLTLSRPEVRNAISDQLIREVTHVLENIANDASIRALVLTGQGSAFCAGADLEWMERAAAYTEAENLDDAQRLAQMLSLLHRLPIPVIARVNGPAVAGGMGLVSACDVVIADRSAYFALTEVRLGLVPATISPYVVRAIGLQACRRYMLSAERISASEAAGLGLVHQVCDTQDLDATVSRIAEAMRAGGPAALSQIKELLAWIGDAPLANSTIAATAKLIAGVRSSPEGKEGLRAFLEKRPTAWQAR
jgi:methylglutaconyl-CoA hydratase